MVLLPFSQATSDVSVLVMGHSEAKRIISSAEM